MRSQIRIAVRTTTALAVLTAISVATGTAFGQTEMPAEIAAKMKQAQAAGKKDKPEFPKFEDVSKDYKKVISTADGKSLYTLYTRKKDGQVLAELPRSFENQKLFIAYNISGGSPFAGIQLTTLSEGPINELHIGLKGTMNALFLKDMADKTRRGLRGRVGIARRVMDEISTGQGTEQAGHS